MGFSGVGFEGVEFRISGHEVEGRVWGLDIEETVDDINPALS